MLVFDGALCHCISTSLHHTKAALTRRPGHAGQRCDGPFLNASMLVRPTDYKSREWCLWVPTEESAPAISCVVEFFT